MPIVADLNALSALDLYRIDKNLPNATLDDMMSYYVGKKSIPITNQGNGTIITHNLGAYVITKFIDESGIVLVGVEGERIEGNLNQVTLRTPVLDGVENVLYNGKLICEKF